MASDLLEPTPSPVSEATIPTSDGTVVGATSPYRISTSTLCMWALSSRPERGAVAATATAHGRSRYRVAGVTRSPPHDYEPVAPREPPDRGAPLVIGVLSAASPSCRRAARVLRATSDMECGGEGRSGDRLGGGDGGRVCKGDQLLGVGELRFPSDPVDCSCLRAQ